MSGHVTGGEGLRPAQKPGSAQSTDPDVPGPSVGEEAQAGHLPVLSSTLVRLLAPRPGDAYLDCTLGRGGHALLFGELVGPTGRVVGLDLDQENLAFAGRRLEKAGISAHLLHSSFAWGPSLLQSRGESFDLLLADLGFASTQIDDPRRGLSFSGSGPLDMRYDRSSGPTAAELLGRWSERELAEVIGKLGEEPLAAKIARVITQARRKSPVAETQQLAELVRTAYGPRARHSRLHPATRTFMALRIAVNDELNALSTLLSEIARAAEEIAAGKATWLRPGARVGVISFHSLEDRLVKHAFADMAARALAARLTRRPAIADDVELAENPRARSAKLRVIRVGRAADGAAEPHGWPGAVDDLRTASGDPAEEVE